MVTLKRLGVWKHGWDSVFHYTEEGLTAIEGWLVQSSRRENRVWMGTGVRELENGRDREQNRK